MKKSTEVLGLKVIGIKEGTDKGVIQDIVIDAEGKRISHLILKDSRGYGFYGLSFAEVLGIGADYVIVPTISGVKKLYESQELLEVIEKGFYLLGATVLSSGGDIIGEVEDFAFNPKGGALGRIMLNNGADFPAEKIESLAGSTVFINLDDAPIENALPEEGIEGDSIRFLLGKTLRSAVVSEDGAFVAEAGTLLTEDILREANLHDALLTLTLNV